ncbi:hypothetical protein MHM84_03750 [Halomonas sp. McH1-25]|uniref:hypothetical protein n=1 Tax=unclassified Halomonas TaxID=2609666 RepID=UPI001EF60C00|nr:MULTISPECIES: hypothetical protein [unclassified Halomonas]MCG7598887.1 hypothetical protein [Halomonas sp. McH1-25]MCP1340850.1 hypothetical protein [Halomonas sp. FL8]MCP1361267.1 hypothetical protein [Halomonas sp. BBD45]MCP1363753.1 hypothetical protein [Halomonas sp. BBD48]
MEPMQIAVLALSALAVLILVVGFVCLRRLQNRDAEKREQRLQEEQRMRQEEEQRQRSINEVLASPLHSIMRADAGFYGKNSYVDQELIHALAKIVVRPANEPERKRDHYSG